MATNPGTPENLAESSGNLSSGVSGLGFGLDQRLNILYPDSVAGGINGPSISNSAAASLGGSAGDWIAAAGGNETLTGGTSTGKNYFWAGSGSGSSGGGLGEDTIYASAGNATMTGGSGSGSNYFVFFNGQAGGADIITNFRPGLDQVDLVGSGASQIAVAVGNQHQVSTPLGGGTQVILSDNTHITFIGITSVTSSNFVTSGRP